MSDTEEDYTDDDDYEDEDFGSETAHEDDVDKCVLDDGGGGGNGNEGDQHSLEQSNYDSHQPLDSVNTFSPVVPPKEEVPSDQNSSHKSDTSKDETDTKEADACRLQSLDGTAQNDKRVAPSKTKIGDASVRPDSPNASATGEAAWREKVWEASKKLVHEGEKNINLALELEKCSSELSQVRGEIGQFSKELLQGINGGVVDVESYRHIPLGELLRLRLQESDQKGAVRDASGGNMPGDLDKRRQNVDKAEVSVGGVQKLERELASEQERNETLEKKCAALHEKLTSTGREVQEVGALRQRIIKLVERSRTERDLRARAEKEVSVANEKIEVLSDHIEKLMVHLKHEAISKVRALNDLTRTNREVDLLQARSQTMAKRNARKDQAISELKEGAKILEDQLKLMDEKYMELRLKLDWTRTQTQFTVKKKEEELQHLRSKFALLTELMPRGEKKGKLAAPLLDEVGFGKTPQTSKLSKFQSRGNVKDTVSTTAASLAKTVLSPSF